MPRTSLDEMAGIHATSKRTKSNIAGDSNVDMIMGKCNKGLFTTQDKVFTRVNPSTAAAAGRDGDEDSSDGDGLADCYSEDDDESLKSDRSEKVMTKAGQGKHESRNMVPASELEAIVREIRALKESKAILESDNQQSRRAFEDLKRDNEHLRRTSRIATEHLTQERSQHNDEVNALHRQIEKMEQELKAAEEETHVLKKRLRSYKSETWELRGELAYAIKVIKPFQNDFDNTQRSFNSLLSHTTDLLQAIHSFDNVPSKVAAAAKTLSDKIKIIRLQKSKKNGPDPSA
ncbi:uncharacterized protein BKA78DRAFT_300721 [Phyllosticta capitalensis]|uniref:Uncharacterized protein n=1 Tax=Phyllosticta capitalensis TaxID=121624 RepID=A0ABR1Y9Y1_9PEZI